jgi:hypothetical protein
MKKVEQKRTNLHKTVTSKLMRITQATVRRKQSFQINYHIVKESITNQHFSLLPYSIQIINELSLHLQKRDSREWIRENAFGEWLWRMLFPIKGYHLDDCATADNHF